MSQVHQPSNIDTPLILLVQFLLALLVHLRQVHPLEGTRRPIGFRPPPNQNPFATRSDSVRRPIGFRPLSDDIPITIKGRKLHIRAAKPQISVGKISENSNVVLTLVVSALSICFMCARTKHHNNIVWANGIIASF